MPVWLRNYTIRRINEYNAAQKEAIEKNSKGKQLPGKKSNLIRKPTYSTKVKK